MRTAILGVTCAWLLLGCEHAPEAEREAAVARVEYIVKWAEGSIEYDKKAPEKPIIGLNFTGTVILDEALRPVGKLTTLQKLKLDQCKRITDDGLAFLVRMPNLHTLSLQDMEWLTDDGVEHVSKLRKLQSLDLTNCVGVTDVGLGYLKELPALRRLVLFGCNLSGPAVNRLKAWNQELEIIW